MARRMLFTLMGVIAGILAAGFPLSLAWGEPARVLVLSNQEIGPYRDLLTGLRQYLTKQAVPATVEVIFVQGNAAKIQEALTGAKDSKPRVLVTLGSTPTQAAVREVPGVELVASMIINADELQKSQNATAVVLDFPLDTQFQWMRRVLPKSSMVGVLFNPVENQTKISAATRVAQSLGITLIPREVETPRELPDALEAVSRKVDILWGVTDQTVMTPQTAEPILVTSFRNKIPLTGLSTSWVKAGALYALDRDYTDIGTQCGEMVAKILSGTKAGSIPSSPPRKVTYALNLKTASLLNVELSEDLVKGAAQVFR